MSLDPTFVFGGLDLAAAPFAIAFGHDRGSPEAVVADVQSSLGDGSMTKVTRWDNRTVTLPVVIQAATMQALSDAEALLVAETLKERNQFTFNPGDGTSADSVFDTFTADLVQEYDDDREIALMRLYTLTLQAHPWPHSANKVITPALVTAAPTSVDTGAATTNWTAPVPTGATLSVVSGAVRSTYNPATTIGLGLYGASLRRTATVSTSTDKYISVDWKTSLASYVGLQTNATVGNLPEVRREPGAVAGFTRSWFQVPDSVTSLAWFEFGAVHAAGTGSATLEIDLVQKAATLPASGTARQLTRTIDPGGSVPAEGTVQVAHATAGLGQVIVFSHPATGGYNPPLRQWRVASDTVTADSSLVSGSSNPLLGLSVFNIPATAVPSGDVHLWARLSSAANTGLINIYSNARQFVSGALVGGQQNVTTTIGVSSVNAWELYPIARFTMPNNLSPASLIQIQIQRDTGSTLDMRLDEAWLFAMDAGRLTALNVGTGTPAVGSVHNRLRVSAPSLTDPFGRLEVATQPDYSDAFTPSAVYCDQRGHKFSPDGSLVFTVTSGVTDAVVSLEHYPRWHSNAGS